MKGRIARLAALALALLLAAAYGLLPNREELSYSAGSGHDKWALEDGDSVSWTWTPALAESGGLTVPLKGTKKAQGMTLTATLTDGEGREAASVTQRIADLEEGNSLRLTGRFQTGTVYTLTVRAEGEGKISVQGEEDGEGRFIPSLEESGIAFSRNPVLLYFAAGMLLLSLMPVTGTAGNPRRRDLRRRAAAGGNGSLAARLLPWGTFCLILGVGLLVALRKPTFFDDPTWGTWDEDAHASWVRSMSLLSWGGLRGCLNSVITWHPGYLPLGVGYNIGEALNALGLKNPGLPYRCAVITGTACYAGMCALAVRHAPRFKVSFLVAGSIPMMIFQATSMTYDTAVTASVLLGTALVMETIERPGRLTEGRAITLAALLGMGTVAKPAYSLALLSLLMIPKEKFGSRKEKALFRVLAVLMTVWCFAAMAMPGAYEDVMAGDLRFSDTDAQGQIRGMLADPFGSGLKPVRYFFENISQLTGGWLSFWAYVGFGMPYLNELYLILMLCAAPLCCCGETWDGRDALTPGRRIGWGCVAFFAEVLLIYAQYIASSPVGGAVTGMQPRYFMPLWMPALLALMWPKGIRKRTGEAGDVMAVAVFALCCWANIENALIHLANFGV